MRLVGLTGMMAWLLVAAASPTLAQGSAPGSQLAAAVDRAVFAEAVRWKAKLRVSEAQAVATIQSLWRQIDSLKRQRQSDGLARKKLSSQIGQLETEAETRTAALLAEIERRDDEIARLLQGFRRNILNLADTPQGREALAAYNEGRPLQSDALIARLDEQELATSRLAIRFNEAARLRRRAELLLPKIGQGGVTIEMTIGLFEQAVARDDSVQSDWVNLANLYTIQRKLPKAEHAVSRARSLASAPVEASQAGLAAAGLAASKGEFREAAETLGLSIGQLRTEWKRNPAVQATLAREIEVLGALEAAFQCFSEERFLPCFDARLATAETLMRAYNAQPASQRRLDATMEPFILALRAMFFAEQGDPRSIAFYERAAARIPELVADPLSAPETLDLLFTIKSQIAIQHLAANRPDPALIAFGDALGYQRRLIALDPSAVQPKFLLAHVATVAAAVALTRSDRLMAVDLLNEAGRSLDALLKVSDFAAGRELQWRTRLLTGLLDPAGFEAKAILAEAVGARAKGLIAESDHHLVELLRARRAALEGRERAR